MAGCERVLDVDKALVVAAAEVQADVALGLDEGAINEDIEFAHDVEQSRVFLDFLPGDDAGKRVDSSRPHLLNSVVGVVRYKI